MTSFQKPTIKIIENFTDMKPFKCLEYPNQVSKIIWEINSNNILQSSIEIIDYIKSNKISVQLTLHLISAVSEIRIKEISLFAEVYQKILNEFACMIIPTNKRLAALLFYKDVNFPNYKPKYDLESLTNIFSKESPLYYIAWDKVDELKSRYPNLNVNMKIRNDYVPTQPFTFIDCACRFGSELCFNYLKNSGAEYTEYTPWYAIQGGNENIISQMIDEGITFDDLIQAALELSLIHI